MTLAYQTPTTLDGVKRLAKRLKAQHGLQHARALDQAAIQSGFNNYIDATRRLSSRTTATAPPLTRAAPGFEVRVTIGWRDRDTRQTGLETLSVRLTRRLADLATPDQMRKATRLGNLRLVAADALAGRDIAYSQEAARRDVCQALRTLQFIDATGLRPSTSRYRAYPNGDYGASAPGTDHATTWYDPRAKAYVIADEPYRSTDAMAVKRAAWADQHGYRIAKPAAWGMYYPDGGTELFLIADGRKGYNLAPLVRAIDALGEPLAQSPWKGASDPFDTGRLQPPPRA